MKRMKTFLAITIATLIFLTGCQLRDTTWVYELDGERLPAGVYILFLDQALLSATELYHEEWLTWEPAYPDQERPPSLWDVTPSEMLNLPVEGVRFYDWMVTEAQRLSRQYFAVYSLLEQYEIPMDPDLVEQTDQEARTDFQGRRDLLHEIGVAESSLIRVHRFALALNTLFHGLYDEDGPHAVDEDELREFFEANYVRGSYMLFWKDALSPTEDETEEALREVEEANAELRQLAETLLVRVNEGEDLMTFWGELDPSVVRFSGELFIVAKKDNHSFDEIAIDGLAQTRVGQGGIFESDTFIALVQRMDVLENEADLTMRRRELSFHLRYEDHFNPMLDQRGSELPLIVNEASIRRYSPANLMD